MQKHIQHIVDYNFNVEITTTLYSQVLLSFMGEGKGEGEAEAGCARAAFKKT